MNKISIYPDKNPFQVSDLLFITNLKTLKHDNSYLVGGTVRDILIGKHPVDIDIVVTGDVEVFSKRLAKEVNGVLFMLDKGRGVYRVVIKDVSTPLHFDISPIRGGTIHNDLSLRDFTVDAMAIPLSDIDTIIDPYNGEKDIRSRCIRVISEKSFEDDPLRLIRAFRLSSTLSFEIEEATFNTIKSRVALLKLSAGERVRAEFFKILSSIKSSKYLRKMNDAGLLKEVITGFDEKALSQGIIVLERMELLNNSLMDLFPDRYPDVINFLNFRIEDGITTSALLKFLSFYLEYDVSEDLLKNALKGLRLGKKACKFSISGIKLKNNLIVDRNVRDSDINNKREVYRFFKDAGNNGIGFILYQVSAFTQFNDISVEAARNAEYAISWYLDDYRKILENRIISGDEIKELFHIKPGTLIKQLLDIIEENRATGLLSTKEDALTFLKKLVTNV